MGSEAPFLQTGRFLHAMRRSNKSQYSLFQRRKIHLDGRARLSNFWVPAGGIATLDDEHDNTHRLLERAGFVRASHSGVFHLLPLGVRVQEKLERLVDKHMQSVGACKVSLSSITSEKLWEKSGRLNEHSEVMKIKDRKNSLFMLSPTHEEEITRLVGTLVHSYKETPLRLYQIGRKYRDELRPRAGLLRAREFLMKDLYTFDATTDAALKTYQDVTKAYKNFFDEVGIPYLVAQASSGAMGGDMSHEYHYPSQHGEDLLYSCPNLECGFVANVETLPISPDTGSKERTEHSCPQCSTKLSPVRAIEVGHTFHLGTRYSLPLSAQISYPTPEDPNAVTLLEMGCHGIGLSRLIPAVASSLAQSSTHSLQWPQVIAPFEVVIIPGLKKDDAATSVYDFLVQSGNFDVVLDDRTNRDFTWKMKDADMIGYPVVVIVGRAWDDNGIKKLEIQWQKQGKREKTVVSVDGLEAAVKHLLESHGKEA